MIPWGQNPSKWTITTFGGLWWVRPPIGSFWGRYTCNNTFEEARLDFVQQTAHVTEAADVA